MTGLLDYLTRKKRIISSEKNDSKLASCLTTWDLTSLGIGATLGAGIYVVSGQVAANIAGPAVVISFAIAAFASILSGLCYAEFGARVPKTTGSAYAYSYVAVGEVWAFVIGWNLILEYMIGTAADARALSGCFDFVIGNAIRNFTLTYIGEFNAPGLATYPDILSFVVTVVVTAVLATGVKQSSTFTTAFNVVNILVVLFIVVAGLFFVETKNWTGRHGFFPYGTSGVFSGAATCFYAYVGFDIIATTGEEAKNATKSIPIAIVSSLVIVFVCYIGVSAVVTLMVPFDELDRMAPIPRAFAQKGLPVGTYIIGVGAVCGLSASLLGSQFPLPRIIYAMSSDGLIFKYFSQVNPKTEVPVRATVYPGILTAFVALLFDLNELVEMMSIGTLLAYSLVSLCVLILRYQPDDDVISSTEFGALVADDMNDTMEEFDFEISNGEVRPLCEENGLANVLGKDKNTRRESCSNVKLVPTAESGRLVRWTVLMLFICFFAFCSLITYGMEAILLHNVLVIGLTVLFGLLCILSIFIIASQPQNPREISFKAPLVPGLPILAVFFNVFLMLKLSRLTWIRFGVWMATG